VTRQKHSEKRLEELLEEDAEQPEPRGILELFPPQKVLRTFRGPREVERDEDAPLTRAEDAE